MLNDNDKGFQMCSLGVSCVPEHVTHGHIYPPYLNIIINKNIIRIVLNMHTNMTNKIPISGSKMVTLCHFAYLVVLQE